MDRLHRRYGSGEADGHEAEGTSPGKRTLTERIWRRAAGPAPAAAPPGEAFAAATSGAPSSLPFQAQLEAAFGFSFGGVQAHVGTPEARAGLSELGARAAAHGESVAFADGNPDLHLVAHEVAHVVQARNGGGGVQARATTVSEPGDAAELAADRAADAVVSGRPVPAVGTADGVTLHRATVVTNGGTFDDTLLYAPFRAGSTVGGNARIQFTPNDLVEAPAQQIALIQSVKADTNQVAATGALHPTNDQNDTAVSNNPDDTQLVVPSGRTGAGRAIDVPIHQPGRTDANHNPIYGVGFGAPDPSTNLGAGTPTLGMARRGDHVRNPDGTFQPPTSAIVEDGPRRTISAPGQTFDMTFEIAALVTGGPMASTYLGSLEWGWSSDATGTPTMKPIREVASGAPSAGFMGAARTWNDATFHQQDAASTPVASIDLPLTSLPSGVRAAVNLPTRDLIPRLAAVSAEVSRLPAGSVDRTNKEFEQRALDTELRRRNIVVEVTCNQLSDTGGAARPAEDEVWLTVEPPRQGVTLTGTRTYRAGSSHTYTFPVGGFLPLDGPVRITLMEHDRAGRRSRAHDDAIVELPWAPPYDPTTLIQNTHGDYTVSVHFDR